MQSETAHSTRRMWGVISLCFWLLCIASIIVIPAVRCTKPPAGQGDCRTVHVKVLVNPAVSSAIQWQNSIVNLFNSIDPVVRSWARIAFVIDTMEVWDIERSRQYDSLLLGDCLMKEQHRGKSDIVVYFGSSGAPPTLIDGMTLYELGYAYIQLPEGSAIDGTQAHTRTYYSLLHWFGHMFGALHCYFDKNNITVMNPFIHEGIIVAPDNGDPFHAPKIHPGNSTIMTALSRRPFDERQWDSANWPPIKKCYEQVRNSYNKWKIDASGELVDYLHDAFHEGNGMLYLSSWASLCGRHEDALRYIDSLELVYRAIKNTCIKEGIIGKTKLCDICGYNRPSVTNWFEVQLFHCEMRRALLCLRAGNIERADSCFQSAMTGVHDDLGLVKDKYANGYRMWKERYKK